MTTNLNDTIETLLSHKIDLENLDFITISKLLTIADYMATRQDFTIINEKLHFIISRLLSEINTTHIKKIAYDFKLLNLIYALKVLNNPKDYIETQDNYLSILSNFLSLQDVYDNVQLIKLIWKEKDFENYITRLSKFALSDSIFTDNFLIQQKKIYTIFYLSIILYERGASYKILHLLLYKLFKKAIKRDQEELVFYLYTPLLFSWNGVSQTQEDLHIFNTKVERKLEKFIKKSIIPKYKIIPSKIQLKKKKIKVAFLHDRIINHSIFRAFYSLMKLLKENPNNKYEFIIYNLDFPEFGGSFPKSVKKLGKLDFKYINLHEHFGYEKSPLYSIVQKSLKIRKKIIDDDIDVLISTCARPEDNFLFTSRTAPKQFFWSHGNFEYDINGINKKITHCNVQNHKYDFKNFQVLFDLKKYTPKIDKKEIKKIRSTYPKDVFILGSIGRLVKIDNDKYLKTVATIMKQNPHTIYLACGSGDKTPIMKKVKKFDIQDRFYFTGHIDPHSYGYIIDLYLNTFPFASGEATTEFAIKGHGVLNNKHNNQNILLFFNKIKI